jgi:type II secretion system protein G
MSDSSGNTQRSLGATVARLGSLGSSDLTILWKEVRVIMRRHVSGFTLIELLIVVAIIAILAAIAVPNFLEAQTRAKVSRVKADLRALATGLEAYIIDYNSYPLCNSFAIAGTREPLQPEPGRAYLEALSTPVSYMTNAFLQDPFTTDMRYSVAQHSELPVGPGDSVPVNVGDGPQWSAFTWQSWDCAARTSYDTSGFGDGPRPARSWLLQSGGPDRHYLNMGGILDNFSGDQTQDLLYDATYGTVSFGGIFRTGGNFGGDSDDDDPGDTACYGGGFASGVARNN